MEKEENIFEISVEWVQLEAEKLVNRRLNEDELHSVKKGLEWGLLADIDNIFKTMIEEATESKPNFDED